MGHVSVYPDILNANLNENDSYLYCIKWFNYIPMLAKWLSSIILPSGKTLLICVRLVHSRYKSFKFKLSVSLVAVSVTRIREGVGGNLAATGIH